MTNDEFRMTNQIRMTNDELRIRHSDFVIDSSFWFRHSSFLLIGLLVLTLRVNAQSAWVLTSADFRSERVALDAIDAAYATVRVNSQQRRVELDRVLMLERVGASATTSAKFVAVLAGNDRACGQPKSIEGEHLVWTHPTLGELTLPLKAVMCIARANQPIPNLSAPQTEDIVTLNNGDSVRGITAGISASSVSVQQAGGETTTVPLDSASRVTFASTATARPTSAHGYRVGLIDGSAITAATIALADQKLSFALPDGSTRSVPQSALVSIEHINGPVVWLSSLMPTEQVQTPFMDLAWPARMDRAVDGDAIRFGDRTYARGIGVHAYSKLTYPIEPGFKTFRTQYAISGDRPYANVTVRVRVDDQVVHEQADVRTAALAQPLLIDVDGHKQLTLEVDYGQNYDVQDRFNWIEPAFLRFKPEPPPASQPN